MIEAIVAIISLGVGDYADPLNLSAEDKKEQVFLQESCETSTTIDSSGESTTTKTCKSMKTITKNEEED
jgi:hypothetical protein